MHRSIAARRRLWVWVEGAPGRVAPRRAESAGRALLSTLTNVPPQTPRQVEWPNQLRCSGAAPLTRQSSPVAERPSGVGWPRRTRLSSVTRWRLKPTFPYDDFPVTSATTRDVPFSPNSITPTSPSEKCRGSRRNEIWANGDITVYRGRHVEVGIVEFGLIQRHRVTTNQWQPQLRLLSTRRQWRWQLLLLLVTVM